MGEPITLVKGDDEMIVYGLAQAAVHISEGWQAVDENTAASLPKPDTETEKATTPVTKKSTARKPRASKATG